MNILESVLLNDGGRIPAQLATAVGIPEAQARDAITQLLPAIARGASRNAAAPAGATQLFEALSRGHHATYVEHPDRLGEAEAVREGNGILGHVFGNKAVSRQVADRAAAETGLGADVLKKLLPLVASMTMGALSQRAGGSAAAARRGAPRTSGGLGDLAAFLDFNRDGSIADDVLDMVGRHFG